MYMCGQFSRRRLFGANAGSAKLEGVFLELLGLRRLSTGTNVKCGVYRK